MENTPLFWLGFTAFVIGLLLLDLLVFNRKAHEIKLHEALGWSAFWVALSLTFNLLVYRTMGHQAGLSLILIFIGTKILLENVVPIPMPVALGVVGGVLGLSMLASVLWPKPAE